MAAVADSTPLIAFARIGRLDLLRELFGTVKVPPVVHEELVVRGAGRPGAEAIAHAAWIERTMLAGTASATFTAALAQGEREAILLALETSLMLVTDDRAAHAEAQRLGARVTWTLPLLIVAEERGLVPDAGTAASAMVAAGLHVRADVLAAFGAALDASRKRR